MPEKIISPTDFNNIKRATTARMNFVDSLLTKPSEREAHFTTLAYEFVKIILGELGEDPRTKRDIDNAFEGKWQVALDLASQWAKGLDFTDDDWKLFRGKARVALERCRLEMCDRVSQVGASEGDAVVKTPVSASRRIAGLQVGSGEMFLDITRPKMLYHPTKPSVQVFSRREIEDKGPEWSETYTHQEYPKAKYHWNGQDKTVKNAEEEAALGNGWADTPAAFALYKGPRSVRAADQDPGKWLAAWFVPGLAEDVRRRIRAQLLRADALFLRAPDQEDGAMEAMRQAFSGIAGVLHAAGILTEEVLQTDLPNFVWDSAIAGAWWRRASQSRLDIFPEAVGHYWIWRADNPNALEIFNAETAEWMATLLEHPAGTVPNGGLSDVRKATATKSDSWSDLSGEFDCYVAEYDQLAGDVDFLRPGKWALIRASSPRAERIYKNIATKAAAKAMLTPADDKTEPWQLWVEFMWSRGWHGPERRAIDTPPIQRANWTQFKRAAEESARTMYRLFQTSADCCRDLDEENPSIKSAQTEEKPSLPNNSSIEAALLPWPDPLLDLSTADKREHAVSRYIDHWKCSAAGLARTARVDPADLSKWKKGQLKQTSDKTSRLEKALRENQPPTAISNRPDD